MAAVLASIAGKSDGATAGLRKVTADMKSKHGGGGGARAPAAPARAPPATPAPAPPPTTGPPPLECEQGRKWVVENQSGPGGSAPPLALTLDAATVKQSVVVSCCADVVVTIPAKVNAVSVDGCARAGVSLVGAVAAVELVNCRRLTLHVSGRAPSIAVDKCAGVTLVLDGGGEGVDVTTAMSTEVNIVLPPAPGAPADADPVELAVPEQFVTRVVGGRLVTAPVAHSGA